MKTGERIFGNSGNASLVLCDSKNKPPAMQGEESSLDKSNSCARIDVGLQTTNIKAQEIQNGQ